MLRRKIEARIVAHLRSSDKILVVTGARQVGKSYIVRHSCKQVFPHFVELNLADDSQGNRRFANVKDKDQFYLRLSAMAGAELHDKSDTVIFLDEIQEYPHLFSMLKSLREDGRYTYIVSGSLLGVSLRKDIFLPMGSVAFMEMFPLDFEEYLWANGVGDDFVSHVRSCCQEGKSLEDDLHELLMNHWRRYLISGGMPDVVNLFLDSDNVVRVRDMQHDIVRLYGDDASKYEMGRRLKIRRLYEMIPSLMENRRKRVVFKDIEDNGNRRYSDYVEEFDYLINSGIALEVQAISSPIFPLLQSAKKNLMKLYMNDVGLLTAALYHNNVDAIMDDKCGVNLGAVYESVAAQELKAHGHKLYYYDNKQRGEVDYIVDDYDSLSVLPIEIKSGKDYTVHSAIDNMMSVTDYGIKQGYVFSNERLMWQKGNLRYLPIYAIVFI